MKASERLRELADSWGDDVAFTPAQVQALASLVEAAETVVASAEPRGWETPGHPMNEWTKREPILRTLPAALTALRNVLEGGDVT